MHSPELVGCDILFDKFISPYASFTVYSQHQLETVMTAVVNLCIENPQLPQHIVDSIVDLISATILLYNQGSLEMLSRDCKEL